MTQLKPSSSKTESYTVEMKSLQNINIGVSICSDAVAVVMIKHDIMGYF